MREFFGEPMRDPVELVPYEPAWLERFQGFRERIVAVLDAGVRIDHVGSTAVPGLLAKPVIDIQVAVADLEDEAGYRPGLESLGWPLRGRSPDRRFFRPPPGRRRLVHVHVVQAGTDHKFDHLLFRDFMCVHAAVRDAYAQLKLDLAAEHGGDPPTLPPRRRSSPRRWPRPAPGRRLPAVAGHDRSHPRPDTRARSTRRRMPRTRWRRPSTSRDGTSRSPRSPP